MVDLAVCDRKEKGCKFQVFSFSRYLGVIMWSEWTNNGSRSSNGLSTRDIYGKATPVLQSLNDAVERCGRHRNNDAAHTMGVAGSRCGSAGRFGIEWNPRIGLVGDAVAQVTAHQLDGPKPDDVPQRL